MLEGEKSPKIALHETPVIFVGLVRHHNQDINVLIVVAPDLGGRPDSDAGVVRFSDSLALAWSWGT